MNGGWEGGEDFPFFQMTAFRRPLGLQLKMKFTCQPVSVKKAVTLT